MDVRLILGTKFSTLSDHQAASKNNKRDTNLTPIITASSHLPTLPLAASANVIDSPCPTSISIGHHRLCNIRNPPPLRTSPIHCTFRSLHPPIADMSAPCPILILGHCTSQMQTNPAAAIHLCHLHSSQLRLWLLYHHASRCWQPHKHLERVVDTPLCSRQRSNHDDSQWQTAREQSLHPHLVHRL